MPSKKQSKSKGESEKVMPVHTGIFRVKDGDHMRPFRGWAKAEKKRRIEARNEFYKDIAKFLRRNIVLGPASFESGYGFIAKVDVSKPGTVKVLIYRAKNGIENTKSQKKILKDRNIWFEFREPKNAEGTKKMFIAPGEAEYVEDRKLLFQSITLKTKLVPDQKKLDWLFDLEPVKILWATV
ncbi:hypothetical protein [Pseudomonas putida]|uniref:Uncharacterized protein n=1 Tax=Pseudomonas putida TaxID=303 RepID=A0A8I1EH62_PSEPU|nr:hypothetical protein [Pseudomonas putida]MBI6885182.1 hypothetical protein [Pseudomonas putida]